MLAPSRGVHNEDARRRLRIAMLRLCVANLRPGLEPLDGKLERRLGEFRPRVHVTGRLAVDDVAIPRGLEHLFEFWRDFLVGGIVELCVEALAEFFLRQRNVLGLFPDGGWLHRY